MFEVIVGIVALLAAGIASVAGFGIGSLLTPLVATQYGMKTAVAVVSIPHVVATLLRFWRLRGHLDRRVFVGFGLMNAAGALAGALIHSYVDSPVLVRVLGLLLIFAGVVGLTGFAARVRLTREAAWIAGAFSGGFGGLVGIGLAVDAVRMPVYFATEFSQIVTAWPVVIAGLAGVTIGTLAGERVLRRIPEKRFKRVVSGILLGIGAFLLARSFA